MKRTIFNSQLLPWLLLAPQLVITFIFFLWPAAQAIRQSFLRQDAFGIRTTFVGFENFQRLLNSPEYLNSLQVTAVFAVSVTLLSMGFALLLAVAVDRMIRSSRVYTTALVWPYAVAPAVAGILWWFIFNPTVGIMPYVLGQLGYDWNHISNPGDAMTLVVIASAWKQISYNFLFFLAGLQAIPNSLREAAAIEGASRWAFFARVQWPLLMPTTLFVLVNAVINAFRMVDHLFVLTRGGPDNASTLLLYRLYEVGFQFWDTGYAAAMTIVLVVVLASVALFQFFVLDKRVHYK